MTRLLLLPTLLLAACASPEADPTPSPASEPAASGMADGAVPEADTPFDARAWLADVESALADTSQQDGIWTTVRGDVWDRVEARLGLDRACDTYYDGEALAFDPIQDPDTPRRGLLEAVRLGDDEAVVVAQCGFGAYQGSYVLVHVEGAEAVLYEAPVDPGVSDLRAAVLSTPSVDPEARTVTTFGRARGLGDCGIYAIYRLGAGAALDAVEVRERECQDEIPDEIDPSTWPVVYSASD
ncbi:MAG: DUF1176 domain-containing protein [Bacteroidota bacterium]